MAYSAKNKLCLCKVLKPGLTFCRLYGLLSIKYHHKNNRCVYECSKFMTIHSLICIALLLLQMIYGTEILTLFSIGQGKTLLTTLSGITDIIYSMYSTITIILNLTNRKNIANALNKVNRLMERGLLCQSALKSIHYIQYAYCFVICVILSIQLTGMSLIWESINDKSLIDKISIFNKFTQIFPFFTYLVTTSTVTYFNSIFSCYEKLFLANLNISSAHPLVNYEEINTFYFMGIVKFKLCSENHHDRRFQMAHSQSEYVEYLRNLHEDICQVMYDTNKALNPLLLMHITVELISLVIHYYCIVIYVMQEFQHEMAAVQFLNCMFVVMHTLGLLFFLKNCQRTHNTVHRLQNYLLEYSTRTIDSNVQLQVRLFIEKLSLFQRLNASGIFSIDLGIAGPITANILTYVLVALQFKVSK